MYTEVEKAYLAGLFDGEGNIGITLARPRTNGIEYRTHAVYASISNTYLPLMERLKVRWPGSFLIRSANKNSERVIATLRWYSATAIKVLRELEPYLIIKKQQALIALAFADEMASRPGSRAVLRSEEWQRREELRVAISRLNRPNAQVITESPPAKLEQVCAHCGKPFFGYARLNRKYCGLQCGNAARWDKYRAQRATT